MTDRPGRYPCVIALPSGEQPTRKYSGDAGVDIHMPAPGVIAPGAILKVALQVKVHLPDGWFALIQERSSTGQRGIGTLGNVIDTGYTGSLHAVLVNYSSESITWEKGDRLVQIIFVRGLPMDRSLPHRRGQGFGSTGS